MGCLDVLLIVHGIKMSLVCPVLRRKWVRPLWLYRHGYIIVGCGYVRMSRSLALRSHMFVQSEQGGCEYCWIWYRLIKL